MRKQINVLVALTTMVTLSLTACKSGTDGGSDPTPKPLVITATAIQDLPAEASKVEISTPSSNYGFVEISNNGFEVTLGIPTEKELYAPKQVFSDTDGDTMEIDVTVSNDNARMTRFGMEFVVFDAKEQYIGDISYGTGDDIYDYAFVTEDVDISYNSNGIVIDMKLKRGWNRVTIRETPQGAMTAKTDDEIVGARWYYESAADPNFIEAKDIKNLPAEVASIKLYLDSGDFIREAVMTDNGFTCQLPETLPEDILENIYDSFDGFTDVQVSSRTAKISPPAFFMATDINDDILGDVSYGKLYVGGGQLLAYMYSTEDVTASARSENSSSTMAIDLQFHRGWNKIMITTGTEGDKMIMNYSSQFDTTGCEWQYGLMRAIQ
jgi:hypothetical protein